MGIGIVLYYSPNSRSSTANASRPPEHPPVRGKKMSKRLGGIIIGCKGKTSSWYLNGFPDGRNIGSTVNVGEKPTVILYTTYISSRHQGHQTKSKNKT